MIFNGNFFEMIINIMAFVLAFMFVLTSFRNIRRKNKILTKEKEEYNYLLKKQEEYLNLVIKRDEDVRKFRHDLNAHLVILEDLLNKKDIEEANNYINKIKNNTSMKSKGKTSNSVINAIINDFTNRLDEDKIEFKLDFNVGIINHEKNFDIAICIYNLLLNAIEACEKLDVNNRKIIISMEQIDSKFYFKQKNSCGITHNIEKVTKLKTSKNDKKRHGYGLKNVEEIVKKYNGKISYSVKEKFFYTELLL